MAGLLGMQGGPGMGILGGAQQTPDWANKLGLISAAIKDAANSVRGQGDTNASAQWQQGQQQNQIRQQLMGALQSQDPSVRQQGYQVLTMMGGDPSAFQKQQATQQLPQLLASMKPSQQTFHSQSGQLNNGSQITTAPIGFEAPGKSISEAIGAAPPELQAQYAPKLLEQQMTAEADAQKPFDLSPGQHRFAGGQDIASLPEKPNYNAAFNTDGTPNLAFQKYEKDKITTQQAPAWANVDLARQRLAGNIPNEDTLHDMAVRYVKMGDKNAFGAMGRNPAAQTAAQNMISQVGRELGLKPEQISSNQQTFQAGTKAVQAFDTGKQGDTTRSLNVSVAHLNTLKDLGTALNNGDITLINAARQKFAEAFGVPAPTNFDAARAIVADEVAKGVIGGQTAQADREALAASLKRERSPQAINGAIGTFQNLLAGQLHGLRQQYQSSTGRQDFNDKLFPETISVLEGAHRKPSAGPLPPAALPRLPTAPKIRTFNPATGRLE